MLITIKPKKIFEIKLSVTDKNNQWAIKLYGWYNFLKVKKEKQKYSMKKKNVMLFYFHLFCRPGKKMVRNV